MVIKRQLETINKLKTELKNIVTHESGIKKEQRFDFIHQQLHGSPFQLNYAIVV